LKKKALLINPYIEDFTAYDLWLKPLGLYKLSYALKKNNFDVSFIDLLDMSHPSIPKKFSKKRENGTGKFYYEYIPKPEILPNIGRRFKRYGIPISSFKEELKKIKNPDAVFITSSIVYWYKGIITTINIIKEILGDIPVVLGGIYPTLYYHHSKNTGADFVVKGNFEEALPPVLEEIFGKKFVFDFEIYPDYSILKDKTSMAIQTSKGCPYSCSYCASKKIEPLFFQFPLEYNLKNFENLKNFKIKNIAFYDDALLYNKENHIKKILKTLKEKNFNFIFHTPNGLDPNQIDEELAVLFKETNFKTIRLSVDILNKKVKYENLKEIMKNFFKAGYKEGEIEAYLLIGFLEEKFEEIKEALYDLFNLKIKSKFAYFSPIEGTKIWETLKEKGFVKDREDPILSNKLLFPYRFKGIKPEELKELKNIQNFLNQKFIFKS
jgi:radical SAM superfamily enzyme YgiQ (UPF0313 family)